MYFDIYSQENKVLIKDEYDKDVLNITLSFGSNGHLNEGQCREELLVAVQRRAVSSSSEFISIKNKQQ